ncbi:DUF7547 family protein [Haloparvum sedimenti]|uniref:DUF7547 family protein n=1 Tax=Haloparvum sedimenti TaxID=1678448 RepID=UPI00071E82DF|nr:hypothetical protein [Haloparvum sedimenti]
MSPRDDADGPQDAGDDSDRQPTEAELAARLDELEATLRDLRAELRDVEGEPRRDHDRRGPPTTSPLPRPPRPPGIPRPPRLSELLRFTEQYTIPTLIATLEATIKSLELLRATLRLVDPERDLRESGDDARSTGGVLGRAATDATREGLADVRSEAERGLARSLAELRRALEETDLPEDEASRTILDDARDLSAEIEARVREERERGSGRGPEDDRGGSGGLRDTGPVTIDVRDPDEAGDERNESEDAAEDAEADDRPAVDVESELESIKDELDRRKRDREDGTVGGADGGDRNGDADEGDRNGDADEGDRNGDADEGDRNGDADEGDRNGDADDADPGA